MKMKKIVLYVALVVFLVNGYSQNISDVSQTNSNELIVRDIKNNRISSKYISSGDELSGFSSTIIVIKTSSKEVIVYDEKWNRISSKYISSGDIVKNVNGNNIIIKTSSKEVITYDKKWNRISSRYE
jgi:hypothetical protein